MAKIDEKIREYITKNGISITEMAKKAKVSPAYMSQIVNGKKLLGKRQAKNFHELFGFNEDFLLTGNGSLFASIETSEEGRNKPANGEFPLPKELNNLNGEVEIKDLLAKQNTMIYNLSNHLECIEKQLDRCISLFEKIINRSYLSSYMVGEEEPQNLKQ